MHVCVQAHYSQDLLLFVEGGVQILDILENHEKMDLSHDVGPVA